ncbi:MULTISPECIES: ubiquinone anaerobic biosynthesis accessory factor UbiT [Kordiimonas]|jgi:predicted lipid carrier protein YhbT|uniref:Predicted lipid carrier protein YhbT, contains SCP2 domain n=1 Tax=Kordiimonas lacus TaxID=637679 RepID=A0A1G7ACM6_9PROT|nr:MULTISPECIES: SCP2 sterol-binding domain-containing protein [Kordiimonas]SDE11616.1 Predicted lipid carrier protein YhbT, contains SCP2 domain [Kordiimonas lacus]
MHIDLYRKAAPIAARSIRLLPLAPANLALSVLAKRMSRRHGAILDRLRPIAGKKFLIKITDLGVTLLLSVHHHAVAVKIVRQATPSDVGIEGALPLLVALIEGEMDGDALFFTRDLTISGDTEALLTLRNALDSADFSLQREILAAAGPLGTALSHAKRALEGPHHRDQNWQSGHPS